jgi:hypothetical protein
MVSNEIRTAGSSSQPLSVGSSFPLPIQCTINVNLKRKERTLGRLPHAFLSQTRFAFARSFVPLFAIAVIAGVMLWGPWVSLAITAVAVTLAMRLL